MSVGDFAAARGVSRQRVHALIRSGQISAAQIGRTWVIDPGELGKAPAASRPLSKRIAGVLIDALSGMPVSDLGAEDRFHAKKYLSRLREADEPAILLRSWLKRRESRVESLAANPADLAVLARDPAVVASGISDPRVGLSSSHEFEGYVAEENLASVIAAHLLVASSRPNVRLHVVHALPQSPAPLGLVLADLADWGGPREDQQVARLVEGIRWPG